MPLVDRARSTCACACASVTCARSPRDSSIIGVLAAIRTRGSAPECFGDGCAAAPTASCAARCSVIAQSKSRRQEVVAVVDDHAQEAVARLSSDASNVPPPRSNTSQVRPRHPRRAAGPAPTRNRLLRSSTRANTGRDRAASEVAAALCGSSNKRR